MARMFSELEPEWDYTWYDPRALEGFSKELEEAFSAIDGLPAGFPALVGQAFSIQLSYVNETASREGR